MVVKSFKHKLDSRIFVFNYAEKYTKWHKQAKAMFDYAFHVYFIYMCIEIYKVLVRKRAETSFYENLARVNDNNIFNQLLPNIAFVLVEMMLQIDKLCVQLPQ